MSRKRSLSQLLGDEPTAPPPSRVRGKVGGGREATPTRDRLNIAQARLAEAKAAEVEGRLVDVAKVEARWTAAVLDARNALLALPSRLGARFGLTPTQIADADAEVRDILAALAGDDGAANG